MQNVVAAYVPDTLPIGPVFEYPDCEDTVIEKAGSITIFNNNFGYGEHYIQLAVYRAIKGDGSHSIIGHRFEYYSFIGGRNFDFEAEADTIEEIIAALPRMWRGKAEADLKDFRSKYPEAFEGEMDMERIWKVGEGEEI